MLLLETTVLFRALQNNGFQSFLYSLYTGMHKNTTRCFGLDHLQVVSTSSTMYGGFRERPGACPWHTNLILQRHPPPYFCKDRATHPLSFAKTGHLTVCGAQVLPLFFLNSVCTHPNDKSCVCPCYVYGRSPLKSVGPYDLISVIGCFMGELKL